MKNNIFTNPIFIFGIIIVLFVVVTSLIYWGKPLGSSDVMEIKEAIEEVDSDKVSNITFGPLSELDSIDCQSVYYISGDSLRKQKIIKLKKGFLKYKFDGFVK